MNLSLAQTKINDTIIHDGYSGISIYDFIENYKDSVLQDVDIELIRMLPPFCNSRHQGHLISMIAVLFSKKSSSKT